MDSHGTNILVKLHSTRLAKFSFLAIPSQLSSIFQYKTTSRLRKVCLTSGLCVQIWYNWWSSCILYPKFRILMALVIGWLVQGSLVWVLMVAFRTIYGFLRCYALPWDVVYVMGLVVLTSLLDNAVTNLMSPNYQVRCFWSNYLVRLFTRLCTSCKQHIGHQLE